MRVVLVRPQLGENIGAAARVMLNFGLSDLAIVAPRDGWPNEKALEMSAHARDIIENITPFETVADAVADCDVVLATSARNRALNKLVFAPDSGCEHMANATKPALLFGPERTGLTTEDLSLCNGIVTMEVNPNCPSLNLAQAVAVMSYQFSLTRPTSQAGEAEQAAPKKELSLMLEQLHTQLQDSGFYRTPEKQAKMQHKVDAMFARGNWTSEEVAIFRGMLKAFEKN